MPVFKNQLSSVIFSRHLRFRQPKYTFGDKITELLRRNRYDTEKGGNLMRLEKELKGKAANEDDLDLW